MVYRAQPHTHFPLRDLGVLNFPNNHGGPELPEKFWKAEHMDGLAQEIHFSLSVLPYTTFRAKFCCGILSSYGI